MRNQLFVTGTDTGVGKTLCSSLLLAALKSAGRDPGYFKPIQTGEEDDSRIARELSGIGRERIAANTFRFGLPAAPSRAAAAEGRTIDPLELERARKALPEGDWVIEGAGGLLVPIAPAFTFRDWIAGSRVPALLVASTRLGTMNHTLLTLECARSSGIAVRALVLSGEEDPGLEVALREAWSGDGFPPIMVRIPAMEVEPAQVARVAAQVFPPALLRSLFGGDEA